MLEFYLEKTTTSSILTFQRNKSDMIDKLGNADVQDTPNPSEATDASERNQK